MNDLIDSYKEMLKNEYSEGKEELLRKLIDRGFVAMNPCGEIIFTTEITVVNFYSNRTYYPGEQFK